jgi:hypothetical protein
MKSVNEQNSPKYPQKTKPESKPTKKTPPSRNQNNGIFTLSGQSEGIE